MNTKDLAVFFSLVLVFSSMVSFAVAEENTPVSLIAKPGKTACHSQPMTATGQSINAELCILQSVSSHDRYTLIIDGKTVLQGIDDETTNGLSSVYKNQKVGLTCVPQMLPPNVTMEEIQRTITGYPPEKMKRLASLMKGSPAPVEISRLCTASIDDKPFMKIRVIFD